MSNFVSKKIKSNLKFLYSENNTISIIFSKNDDLLGVAGEFNNNIKELEKITNTSIYSRGNSIILTKRKMKLLKMLLVFCMINTLLMDLSKKKI